MAAVNGFEDGDWGLLAAHFNVMIRKARFEKTAIRFLSRVYPFPPSWVIHESIQGSPRALPWFFSCKFLALNLRVSTVLWKSYILL